jgi:hypothetical protein
MRVNSPNFVTLIPSGTKAVAETDVAEFGRVRVERRCRHRRQSSVGVAVAVDENVD